jgi:hypothetical protein
MNKRILKKKLKQKIDRLERDNKLMHHVIESSPGMAELYDRMTKPLATSYTNVKVDKLVCRQIIRAYGGAYRWDSLSEEDRDICIERYKDILARQVGDALKGYINYDFGFDGYFPFVQATIYVVKADA